MTGTNNTNKMATKRFLFLLGVSMIAYLLPEIFFQHAMLYIVGGAVGGTIKEILGAFESGPSHSLVLLIWLILLIVIVVCLHHLQNRLLKYMTILIAFVLLYVVDFIIIMVLPNDFQGYHLIPGINVLLKSIILSLILFFNGKQKRKPLN